MHGAACFLTELMLQGWVEYYEHLLPARHTLLVPVCNT